jgi:hypothetical protein
VIDLNKLRKHYKEEVTKMINAAKAKSKDHRELAKDAEKRYLEKQREKKEKVNQNKTFLGAVKSKFKSNKNSPRNEGDGRTPKSGAATSGANFISMLRSKTGMKPTDSTPKKETGGGGLNFTAALAKILPSKMGMTSK